MISRFYCPDAPGVCANGCAVILPPEAAHHALKVLRLRVGAELVLFDGTGGEYPGRIVEVGRNAGNDGQQVHVALDAWRDVEREPPLAVTLAQALPTGDKMDWVAQKAVELGVTAIQPLQSKRSVVRLAGKRADKRVGHWQQVAIAACEQCGRNRVPNIMPIMELPQYLAQLSNDDAESRLLLAPDGGIQLSALAAQADMAGKRLTLLIGPEGGFDQGEEQLAKLSGFRPISLGPRILRTETAGLAALAAIMTLWGDM